MWSFVVADDLKYGSSAAMDARDLAYREVEEATWKTTHLLETLAEFYAERAAMVNYISYYEAV